MGTEHSGADAEPPRKTRRRGEELRIALLEAAWAEMAEVGYAKLTMEAVAARAHTGVAVLYRRWANKDELALAAFEHHREAHPVVAPDTGSLRGDMLGLLEAMGRQRSEFFAISFGGAFSGLLAATGMSVAQFRDRVLGPDRTANVQTILRRAHGRGEIDLERLTDTVLDMPTDLVRHDLLMSPGVTVSHERIAAIVDELFLPLVLPTGTGRG